MLWDCRCQPQEARDRLAAFGFRGEDVMTPVGALSGGEKSRLRLCMLMGGDINFLILDEPTNHLDIASREWMEDALSDYEQTLLFVSHDRWLIEKFATRIWALEDGRFTDFRGTFEAYRAFRAREAARAQTERKVERKKEPKPRRGPSPEKQLQRLEREIAKTEARLNELQAACEENATDYQKLMELTEESEAVQAALDELYEQWEAIAE